jgi:hypothetical protein
VPLVAAEDLQLSRKRLGPGDRERCCEGVFRPKPI